MSPISVMGIDLGTSSIKTVLIGADGRLLALAAREYPVDTPRPGWAEQDPETWLEAATETMSEALIRAQIAPEEVLGIGLSGQMHGTVCLGRRGDPLRPAIIWADQRSREQVARVYSELGAERLGAWTGNPLATGFMLASWLWLRDEMPEVVRATAHLLLPKDYLRYRLTGQLGCEPSDGSSTLLFDAAGRGWSAPLLEALGIDPALLPPIRESAEVAGSLRPEIAALTGLREGTPVVFGGSDQALQALGHGVVDPGVVSCTIGTGGQIFAPARAPVYDPELRLHLFCHAMPERWHLMAAILAAGLSLRWLRDNVLEGWSYAALADAAVQVPPGSERLFFLPYLAGERTPHMDPQASGAFIGLTLRHNREHMTRAVMEGVVFALRQGLELMTKLGVPVERVVASGGAVAHRLWLQLQADIFNRPIYRTATIEAAAVGAALLAGVGTGLYPDVLEACRQTVSWRDEIIDPVIENVVRYEEAYGSFCRLYPALAAEGFGKKNRRNPEGLWGSHQRMEA
jgi:xylulokinase